MKKQIILILSLFTGLCLHGQIRENIKTVLLHPEKDIFGMPVIGLAGPETLLLSFDDLDGEGKNYKYQFIHCNADWTQSPLRENQYLEAYTDQYILDQNFSLNTLQPYVHYQLTFPNEYTKFTKAGNYFIRVYDENDPDVTVIERPFVLVNTKVNFAGKVKQPVRSDLRLTHQQLEFDMITANQFDIISPYINLKVFVMQNRRLDNYKAVKPKFINGKHFVFKDDDALIFEGGNEFRYFDTKSLLYNSEYIEHIYTSNDSIFVDLLPDKNLSESPYMDSRNDLSGNYIIKADDNKYNSLLESEYTYVTFTLPAAMPFSGGDIHLNGKLTNWLFSPQSKMTYDLSKKAYTKQMLLKQGYYNYQYLFVKQNQNVGHTDKVEGDHWETKNEYHVAAYYRYPGENFDVCIGFFTFE